MWRFNKSISQLLLLGICLSNLILVCESLSSPKKRQICVIGAGATGLTSAKQFSEHNDEFDVVVFEKNSDVGGLWIYTDSIKLDEHNLPVHSSMYKYLRTNLPKELMAFPDYRNFEGEESSCVTHETVLSYLRNYTDHFNLRPYIQFNTLVEKVTPTGITDDWRTTKWQIETRNLVTNDTSQTLCDGVMVCNGHYFDSRIPKIPGIETFPGKIMHSHIYRTPENFTDQNVVILGASSSGIDISIEISKYAKTVYLSHNKEKFVSDLPKNIVQVPGVVSANGSTLTLKDGSTINADAFIYCTGYTFSYPFLDEASGINVDDNHVMPLYEHLININQPSMCLVGLPLLVVHFPLFHVQAKYYVSLMQGNVLLPSKEDMLQDSELKGKMKRYAHFLGDAQWAYNDRLAQVGGFEGLPKFYKTGYNIWHAYRTANLLHYKETNLRILEDGSVKHIIPDKPKDAES